MSRRFTIEVYASVVLELDEVWPDGDAPENATAKDVAAVIATLRNPSALLRDWSLDEETDVVVVDGELNRIGVEWP